MQRIGRSEARSSWGEGRVLWVVLVVALVSALLLAPAVQAASNPPPLKGDGICFYTKTRAFNPSGSIDPTGHGFLQLRPDSGPQAGSRKLNYGFHPKVEWRFLTGSPGSIDDESKHAWSFKVCFPLTNKQYNDAQEIVNEYRRNTPEYVFTSYNCTTWIVRVSEKLGVRLPDTRARVLVPTVSFKWPPVGTTYVTTGPEDPERLGTILEEAWTSGRKIDGRGLVYKNVNNTFPDDTKDPPTIRLDHDSITDVARLAFKDPGELAAGLNLTARDRELPDEIVGVGEPLSVPFRGLDDEVTQLRIDGRTAFVQQGGRSRTFPRGQDPDRPVFRFERTGTFRVTGFVLGDTTVERFRFDVRVDNSNRDADAAVRVRDDQVTPDERPPLDREEVKPLPQPE